MVRQLNNVKNDQTCYTCTTVTVEFVILGHPPTVEIVE